MWYLEWDLQPLSLHLVMSWHDEVTSHLANHSKRDQLECSTADTWLLWGKRDETKHWISPISEKTSLYTVCFQEKYIAAISNVCMACGIPYMCHFFYRRTSARAHLCLWAGKSQKLKLFLKTTISCIRSYWLYSLCSAEVTSPANTGGGLLFPSSTLLKVQYVRYLVENIKKIS